MRPWFDSVHLSFSYLFFIFLSLQFIQCLEVRSNHKAGRYHLMMYVTYLYSYFLLSFFIDIFMHFNSRQLYFSKLGKFMHETRHF